MGGGAKRNPTSFSPVTSTERRKEEVQKKYRKRKVESKGYFR